MTMAAAQPSPVPQYSVHKFRQVYVDVPPAIYHPYAPAYPYYPHPRPVHPGVAASSSSVLKENTPVHYYYPPYINVNPHMNPTMPPEASGSGAKRKMSATTASAAEAAPKKKAKSGASDHAEFPNGSVYCHQCNKKRDAAVIIQCTFTDSTNSTDGARSKKGKKDRRCVIKFCQACLKNRYGESLEEIKNRPKEDQGHVEEESYTFKCPKCRDVCNCPRCRKSKGLEPIGSLTTAARKSGGESNNSGANGVVGAIPKPATSSRPTPPSASSSKPAVIPKPKPRDLPEVEYTRLPIGLTLEETEDRMHIREFIMRFEPVMKPTIAKAHLEELACLTNGTIKVAHETNDDEEDTLVPWVSEPCVKSVILGLLGIIADEFATLVGGSAHERVVRGAMKDIRSAGANMSKMWGVLSILRDDCAQIRSSNELAEEQDTSSKSSENEFPTLDFPDPLSPPLASNQRSTRSSYVAHGSSTRVLHIATSAQLVPVINALVERAIQSDAIHDDFDDAQRESKEKAKEGRECVRKENDRWESWKRSYQEASLKGAPFKEGELNSARQNHKSTLLSIDNSLKVISHAFTPRFSALLGTDNEGNRYYALSPGHYERDDAYNFIEAQLKEVDGSKGKGKAKTRRHTKDEEERRELKEWSWFVGVFGTVPETGTIARHPDEDEGRDEEEEDDDHAWYALWEPAEIKKLAVWIAIKGGLYDPPTSSSQFTSTSKGKRPHDMFVPRHTPSREALTTLVTSLEEYAELLVWRSSTAPEEKGRGK